MAHAHSQYQSTVETISPAIAQEYLKLNRLGNRRVRPYRVDLYANQMRLGHWLLSPQPIVFTWDGDLADGQHRLWAVIKTGMTLQFTVARGVDPAVFPILDAGMGRSLADRSELPIPVVSICSAIYRLAVQAQFACSVDQLLEIYDIFGKDIDILMENAPGTRAGISNASVHLGAVMRIREGHTDYVISQYRALLKLDSPKYSPIIVAFYRQIQDGKIGVSTESREESAARAYKAFDPTIKNKQKLMFKNPEEHIQNFRQVIRQSWKDHCKMHGMPVSFLNYTPNNSKS